MKIKALLHATFLIADLERSRDFYEALLGLAPCSQRPDLGFPGVWYEVGANQQIHLMQLPNPEAGLQRPQHGGRDRHVALGKQSREADKKARFCPLRGVLFCWIPACAGMTSI